MMFALLVLLTLSVVLLPTLPALIEWRRPSDVVPLSIDEGDALDPPFLAHRFAAMLGEALKNGASHLGESEVVRFTPVQGATAWPLLPKEAADGGSHRLWHVEGDAQLPEHVAFYAEVSASAGLQTAEHGVYRALWAGGVARVAAHASVLRWAHGTEVHVAGSCDLAGRVTAERLLAIAQDVRFTLLHAPVVHFEPLDTRPARRPAKCVAMATWPAAVQWDASLRRGFAKASLAVEAQRTWQGDLVCLGDLRIGANCEVKGSLKARGNLWLDHGCRVMGSVFAEGAIHLAGDCAVQGSVVSETAVTLEAGCCVGAPGLIATVAAPHIRVAAGTRVHGTVWAGDQGMARGAAPLPAVAPAPGPRRVGRVAA